MKWPKLLFIGWLTIFPDPGLAAPPDLSGPDPSRSTRRHSDPPTSDTPLPDSLPTPSLLRQGSAANFQLILGRLQLDPVRYRKGSQSLVHAVANPSATASSGPAAQSFTETLHVSSVRGIPTLHYSVTSESMRIMVDADGLGPWRIESQRTSQRGTGLNATSETTRVIVEQVPNRPLVMKLQSDAPGRVVHAATWLHLRESDRVTFEKYLEPIIDEMLWPYRLSELADDAHSQSLRDPRAPRGQETVFEDSQITAWIDDLRSPVRTDRVDADRNLQSVGISLLPRLASIDLSRLDAEQRQRLSEIREKLTPAAEDNGARLSKLIRDDRSYWKLAEARLNDRDRQIVDARFKRLSGDLPDSLRDDSVRVAIGDGPVRR